MTQITGKTVLITGANGFLGSQLCAAFTEAGAEVIALHRHGSDLNRLNKYCSTAILETLASDYSNLPEIFTNRQPDVVVHTAAAQDSGDNDDSVRSLIATNLLFSTLLLANCKSHEVQYFINTGTSWQNYHSIEYDPVNLYAATKQAFEAILLHYQNEGLKAITLRLCDSYGRDDPRSKITNLLKRIAEKGDVLAMSPGHQQIDLVHVEDIANAYIQAAVLMIENEVEGVYAISSRSPIPLRDFVALYEKARGVKCPINWGGRPYRSREVMVAWNTGRALPHWTPKITLGQGLKKL